MLGTRMVAMANRNRGVSQRLSWDFWWLDLFFRFSSRWGTIIEEFCDTETVMNLLSIDPAFDMRDLCRFGEQM